MAEAPKLTESEAVRVRAWLLPQLGHAEFSDLLDRGLISSWSALGESGSPRADITDLGRAALAAYDAEQRRAIRVEAMHECILAATAVKAAAEADGDEDDDVFDLAQERAYGAKLVLRAIADLIAKEESNG